MDEVLYENVVRYVIGNGVCRAVDLQRRFHVGYFHAIRLIECMQADGIVGPLEIGKGPPVLLTADEWLKTKS